MADSFIDLQFDVAKSQATNNKVRASRASVNRVAVALERALKEEAPINKSAVTNRGGNLRSSIKVRVTGDMAQGYRLRAEANSYVKYVLGGTVAHRIQGKPLLAFLASTTHSWAPVSGYARGPAGDLRGLVRSSGAMPGQQVYATYVNHPGSSANDFVSRALIKIGPELAVMEDEIGSELANDIMNGLGDIMSGTSSVRF